MATNHDEVGSSAHDGVWRDSAVPVAVALSTTYFAQGEIFNVSSGDVLDKGKVYGEFDFAYLSDASAASYTPRVVAGVGKKVEIGMNLNGVTNAAPSEMTPAPTIKSQAYSKNGWALLVGDDVFIPIQNKTYNTGNYFYGEITKILKMQTRLALSAIVPRTSLPAATKPEASSESSSQSASESRWLQIGSPGATQLDISRLAQ